MSQNDWEVKPSASGTLWFVRKPDEGPPQEIVAYKEDMARRIAACLNSWEGVPVEAIEGTVRSRALLGKVQDDKRPHTMRQLVNDILQENDDEDDNSP